MTSRRHTIIEALLEQYAELTDPVRAGNGNGQTGLLLMPHSKECAVTRTSPPRCTCVLRSMLELERLLAAMRDDRHAHLLHLGDGTKVSVRALWWQLNERYLRCNTSIRTLSWKGGKWHGLTNGTVVAQPGGWQLALATERTKKRKTSTTQARVRVVTWHPDVRTVKVEKAVGWLADNWALDVEPMLPREQIAA